MSFRKRQSDRDGYIIVATEASAGALCAFRSTPGTAVPKIFRTCRASFLVTDSANPNGPVTNGPSRMAAPAFRMACEGLASRGDSVFVQLAFSFNRVVFVQRFVNLFPQADDRLDVGLLTVGFTVNAYDNCNGDTALQPCCSRRFREQTIAAGDLGNNQ